MRNSYAIQSVEKALKILQAFDRRSPELGLSELSERMGFPKSVTFKLARTLLDAGFLQQDEQSRRYRIGPGVLTVAGAFLSTSPMIREGAAVLRHIADQTGHTATLGIQDRADVLFIAVAEGTQVVRATAGIGDRRPIHSTATGKVLLADLTETEVRELLRDVPLPRFTPRTIGDLETLLTELETVRRTQVAFNLRERTPEASALAVPVRDFTARVVAGIAVTFPAQREEPAFLEHLAGVLTRHVRALSKSLGATHVGDFPLDGIEEAAH